MNTKIIRYGLAVIFGLALVSFTMHAGETATSVAPATTSTSTTNFWGDLWNRFANKAAQTAEEAGEEIFEKIKTGAGNAAQGAFERVAPIGEKAASRISERVTGLLEEKLDVVAARLFDGIDKALGKEKFEITPEMLKDTTTSFADVKASLASINPAVIAQTLSNLSQLGTSVAARATDPVKLTNTLVGLNESVKALAELVQVKGALDAAVKLITDAVEQGLTLFDDAYAKGLEKEVIEKSPMAEKTAQGGTNTVAKQAYEAITELRKQLGDKFSPILNYEKSLGK